ncbi:hypothetical protein DFS34DRAFT_194616 [Phlyctochytrium arcticum]|nr:hypothetical protein DFS34DRAFT_194616 [Phlyctochytrium arcticum]
MPQRKQRVIPRDVPRVIRGIGAASLEQPMDPTLVQGDNFERFIKSTWLPPLAESAKPLPPHTLARITNEQAAAFQTDTGGKKAELSGKKVVKKLVRPEGEGRNRFPVAEFRKADAMKKSLKSCPTSRYILAFRDKAFRSEERARAYAEAARLAALSNERGIDWNTIRPLSRDPTYGALLKNAYGRMGGRRAGGVIETPKTAGVPPSRGIGKGCRLGPAGRQLPPLSNAGSMTSLLTDELEEESLSGKVTAQTNQAGNLPTVAATGNGAQLPDLLARSLSFTEIKKWMADNPLAKGLGIHFQSPKPSQEVEDVYAFGKPARIAEDLSDQFNAAFVQLCQLGNTVRKTRMNIEGDTDKFDMEGDLGDTLPEDNILEGARTSSLLGSNIGTPDAEVVQAWRKRLENPVDKHHVAFVTQLVQGQSNLATLLETRRRARLQVCKEDSSALQAMKMAYLDVRKCASVGAKRCAHAPWEGSETGLWGQDAYEQILEKSRKKSLVHPPLQSQPESSQKGTAGHTVVRTPQTVPAVGGGPAHLRATRLSHVPSARTRANMLFDYFLAAEGSAVFNANVLGARRGSKLIRLSEVGRRVQEMDLAGLLSAAM